MWFFYEFFNKFKNEQKWQSFLCHDFLKLRKFCNHCNLGYTIWSPFISFLYIYYRFHNFYIFGLKIYIIKYMSKDSKNCQNWSTLAGKTPCLSFIIEVQLVWDIEIS